MAIENQWGKSAVDATRKNALPPYLDNVMFGHTWPGDASHHGTNGYVNVATIVSKRGWFDETVMFFMDARNRGTWILVLTFNGDANPEDTTLRRALMKPLTIDDLDFHEMYVETPTPGTFKIWVKKAYGYDQIGIRETGTKSHPTMYEVTYPMEFRDTVGENWRPVNDETYPAINDVIITSENINPNTRFHGTNWTLIDKEFKSQSRTTASLVTLNNTNITSMTNFAIINNNHDIWIRMRLVNKVAFGDTELNLLTMTYADMGISDMYNVWSNIIMTADNGNGIAMCNWINSNGTVTLTVVDVITKTSGGTIPAGSTLDLAFNVKPGSHSAMRTDFCDKFYWKRI